MDSPFKGLSTEELRQNFKIPSAAPLIYDNDTCHHSDSYYFFFELVGTRVGDIKLSVYTEARNIVISGFFPFKLHRSEDYVRGVLPGKHLESEQEMNSWRMTFATEEELEHLQGKGLGALAHIQVVQWLMNNLPESDTYKICYFHKDSIAPRLQKMLISLDVADMMDMPTPLQTVTAAMRQKATEIFGYKLDEKGEVTN